MNRDIVFRSWNEIDGCFYYFINGFYYSDLDVWHNEVDKHCFNWENAEQFTGLLGKNGVKVFEGDVLKESRLNGIEFYYKVFYKKGGLVINTHQDDFNKAVENILFYESIADMQNSGFIETLEIIGNIHDSNDKN